LSFGTTARRKAVGSVAGAVDIYAVAIKSQSFAATAAAITKPRPYGRALNPEGGINED
jgi:hypothetical protein